MPARPHPVMRTALALATLLALSAPARAGRTGAVAGTVSFAGTPPPRALLDRGTDPVCKKDAMLAEDVLVTGGKLRDVHVRIRSGQAGAHKPPAGPVIVDQTRCMYRPRVVGAIAGQKLVVRNSDPTFHNVRGTRDQATDFNLAHPAHHDDLVRDLTAKPGEVLVLRCDVHPWMRGFVAVTDHPFFAVTGADGAFTIAGLPAGKYTLEAWHPVLGLQSAQVVIKAGKTARTDFTFAKR